jgi:hypothetical protein
LDYTEHSTNFWLGNKYIVARFRMYGEHYSSTETCPEEFPDLKIIEVVELSETSWRNDKKINFNSPDYEYRSKIEDYCWMEWDMYKADKNLLKQENFNDPFEWEE